MKVYILIVRVRFSDSDILFIDKHDIVENYLDWGCVL